MDRGDSQQTAALLVKVAAGDDDAFALLYRQVRLRLIGVAMTVVNDRSLAEDIAHDVLLYTWTHAGRYRPDAGDGLTWLFVITHRRAIDRCRSARRERGLCARIAGTVEPAAPSVEERVILAEERRFVRCGLRRLTKLQRSSLAAVYYLGHSQPEAARRAGVPLPTFKSRLQGGLQRLHRVVAPT